MNWKRHSVETYLWKKCVFNVDYPINIYIYNVQYYKDRAKSNSTFRSLTYQNPTLHCLLMQHTLILTISLHSAPTIYFLPLQIYILHRCKNLRNFLFLTCFWLANTLSCPCSTHLHSQDIQIDDKKNKKKQSETKQYVYKYIKHMKKWRY